MEFVLLRDPAKGSHIPNRIIWSKGEDSGKIRVRRTIIPGWTVLGTTLKPISFQPLWQTGNSLSRESWAGSGGAAHPFGESHPAFPSSCCRPGRGNTRRFPSLGNVSSPAFPFTFQSHLLPGILHIGAAGLGQPKKAGGKWENREQSSWGWCKLWGGARAESFPAGGAGMTFGNGSRS